MTDDRTEDALRRALHDAARQVNVPMGRLPEPMPEPEPEPEPSARPRASARVLAALVVLVLAVGSIAFVLSRNDANTSISSLGLPAQAISAQDADLDVVMTLSVSGNEVAAVRDFAEASPEVAAFTVVTGEQMYGEYLARFACEPGADVRGYEPSEFNAHVRIVLVRVDAAEAVGRELVTLAGVEDVTQHGHQIAVAATTTEPTSPTTTTSAPTPSVAPASTTAASSSRDASEIAGDGTTLLPEPPSTTRPASKEVPFVASTSADCSHTGTSTSPGVPMQPPSPTVAPTEALPPPGDQPADVSATRNAVIAMWMRQHDGSVPLAERMGMVEQHEELRSITEQAAVGREQRVATMRAIISDVVFVSPMRAAVDFRLAFTTGGTDMRQIGYAVLIDGQWLVSRETHCSALARADAHCPEGP